MPEEKLICPFCGADGTPGTARSTLDCYGFNYLEDDVVSREIQGYGEDGKLRLTSEFKCEGAHGTNPRIECRSCWQTFPLPQGVEWVRSEPRPRVVGTRRDRAGLKPEEEVAEPPHVAATDFKKLENTVGGLAGIAGELPALRDEVTALRKQVDSLAEAERQLSFKLARMDTYLREDEESRPRVQDELRRLSTGQEEVRQGLETQAKIMSTLEMGIRQFEQSTRGQQELIDQRAVATNADISKVNERLEVLDRRLQAQAELATGLNSVYSTLQEVQQIFRKRLDADVEAIRAVHLAASANAGRQEELRAALRKLEEIAGALDLPKPLPRDL